MFSLSFNIARVWGIPIRIHISFVLLMLFLWNHYQASLPIMLAVAALLILSITLHELGHSYFALRYGCRVRDITITFIGGAAQMARIPTVPRQEIIMAAAGPIVSFALGGLMLLAALKMPEVDEPYTLIAHEAVALLAFFSHLNFVLGAFNLIPAFPMDGGRIFRALLVRKKGRVEATRQAARLGRLMAWVLGLYAIFRPGDTNWIMVAIAFFIHSAANQELLNVIAQSMPNQQGFPWGQSPSSVDQVIIGPAPYEKGNGSETDVFRGR